MSNLSNTIEIFSVTESPPSSPVEVKSLGKRKKKDNDLPPDERRRKQNREAAQKCRERKRMLIDQLEAQVKALNTEKKTLEDQVRTLSAENRALFEKNKRLEGVEQALKASFPKCVKPIDVVQRSVTPVGVQQVAQPFVPVSSEVFEEDLFANYGDPLLQEEIGAYDFVQEPVQRQPGVSSLQACTFRGRRSVQPSYLSHQQQQTQRFGKIMKQTSSPDSMLPQQAQQSFYQQQHPSQFDYAPVLQPQSQPFQALSQQQHNQNRSVQQQMQQNPQDIRPSQSTQPRSTVQVQQVSQPIQFDFRQQCDQQIPQRQSASPLQFGAMKDGSRPDSQNAQRKHDLQSQYQFAQLPQATQASILQSIAALKYVDSLQLFAAVVLAHESSSETVSCVRAARTNQHCHRLLESHPIAVC